MRRGSFLPVVRPAACPFPSPPSPPSRPTSAATPPVAVESHAESSPRDSGHGDEWKSAFGAGSTNSSSGATSRRMRSRGLLPPPPNGG